MWRILLLPIKMEPHPTKQLPSKFNSKNYKCTVNLIWKLCKITSSAHPSVYIIYITLIQPRHILFHFLYHTDKNYLPHYRCTDACTHQPLVSICDLKLSWQLYETKPSHGISHAMMEFRTVCCSLSLQLDVTRG